MKIMVLGADGYIGWPLSMFLASRGMEVVAVDSMVKRHWEAKMGVQPLWPIATLHEKIANWNHNMDRKIRGFILDCVDYPRLCTNINDFRPDAVVHLAEQASAPYSMASPYTAVETQTNNVVSTLNLMNSVRFHCPDCQIVKLGTMGEYGTPSIDIEEGWLDVEHKGRRDRVLFPKRPGSLYHLSKVHDSHNLEFACRTWNLKVTDLNQGVVYGTHTKETNIHPNLSTSFHYDSIFGTALNRFITQIADGGLPTVYGEGGQSRGFINLLDSLECIFLAITKPAERGEFRVMNQMTEQFTIYDLATEVGRVLRGSDEIKLIRNPRDELEWHYYNPTHTALPALGLKPTLLTPSILKDMFTIVSDNKHRINKDLLEPKITWN